jgi:hypothetical protein
VSQFNVGCGTPARPAPVPNIIVRPGLFLPEDVVISDHGQYVEFKIGNSVLTFHYEDALKVSQMLRVHAKHAKRLCGDVSRHWSAIGTLEALK